MSQSRSVALGDGVAIGLSSLCLLHCLALPVAASLLPLAGAWAQAEWVHWLFVAVAAPISAWVLLVRTPRSWPLIALAGLGLALLVAGAAEFPSHDLETPVTVAGGVVLALTHVLNWRARLKRNGQPPCEVCD